MIAPENGVASVDAPTGNDPAPDLETRILLCAARRTLTPVQRLQLQQLVEEDVDWRRLYASAYWHNMLPLLYWHLRDLAELVPAPVVASLETFFRQNTARMLALTAELLTIVRTLEAQGVPCVPYKGSALAAEAYHNVSLRQSGDIDLVVRRRDLPAVRDLLRSRGFASEHTLTGGGEVLMERSLYHEGFYRDDGCTVEVHWSFSDKHHGFTLDLEALEPRLCTIDVGGEKVRAFSREDLLLILCVHGAKHRWERLEWVAGLASLLRSSRQPAWTALLDRADELGSRRILYLGLRVAHELLEAPLPETVRQAVYADDVVARLADTVRRRIHTDPSAWPQLGLPPHDLFYLGLADRRSDQLRFLLHRLTTPSQAKEWRGIRFGGLYLPIHPIVRPFTAGRAIFSALRWYMKPNRG
jgi:hypothetical protein